VARCRGWMERQSSLLDEFFLFSRRSFKNGRLACKSARDLASWIYFDYFFFHPRTRSHLCHSPRFPFVSRGYVYSAVSVGILLRSLVSLAPRIFLEAVPRNGHRKTRLSSPAWLLNTREGRLAASCCPGINTHSKNTSLVALTATRQILYYSILLVMFLCSLSARNL
jgi:hypothetical protein